MIWWIFTLMSVLIFILSDFYVCSARNTSCKWDRVVYSRSETSGRPVQVEALIQSFRRAEVSAIAIFIQLLFLKYLFRIIKLNIPLK